MAARTKTAAKTAPKSAPKSATKSSAKTGSTASKASKASKAVGPRTRIDTTPSKPGGSRYVRRDAEGQFTNDQVSVGRSLAADRRTKATTKAPKGYKDRGD